jgi:hypothetical protein
MANAVTAKGAPLTEKEHTTLVEDVKKLEEAAKAAEPGERKAAEIAAADALGLPTGMAGGKAAKRRTIRRPVPKRAGLRKYIGMSDADKDAELQTLLGRDMDARNITAICDNIASRDGITTFEDVTRRVTELLPSVERSTLVDAITTATQRKARITDGLVVRLQEIARKQPKKNKRLRTAIHDVLWHLNNGTIPEKDQRLGKAEWDVNQKLAEIRDMLREELRNSEPARIARVEQQIARIESQIANRNFDTAGKTSSPGMSAELASLVGHRDRLAADLAQAKKQYRGSADIVQKLEQDIARLEDRAKNGAYQKMPRPAVIHENEELDSLRSQKRMLQEKLAEMRGKQRTLADLKTKIRAFREGVLPGTAPDIRTRDMDVEEKKLREELSELRSRARHSEPAVQQRLDEQIAFLNSRISNEDYAPRTRTRAPTYDRETYKKRLEVARLKGIIKDRYERLRPKTMWEHARNAVKGVLFLQGSLRGSGDASAIANQGRWQLRSHPIRTLRILPEMILTIRSDADAAKVEAEIANRPNAWLYARDMKGVFTPMTGDQQFTHGEEVIRSRLATRLPIVGRWIRASNRIFAASINRIRADAYDAYAAEYAAEGGPPPLNGRLIGDFVGVTTGRGRFGQSAEKVIEATNGFFWAPRMRISNLMLTAMQPLLRHQPWRVRKLIAKEYARQAVLGYLANQLLGLIWGPPEDKDPTSSHYLQWRIPGSNTYVSPMGGLGTAIVFLSRLALRHKKTSAGDTVSLRAGETPYGGDTLDTLVSRYLRTGLAPGPAAFWNAWTGENPVGEEAAWLGEAAKSASPLILEDVYGVMTDDMSIPNKIAAATAAWLGVSVHTEEDRVRKLTGMSGRRAE